MDDARRFSSPPEDARSRRPVPGTGSRPPAGAPPARAPAGQDPSRPLEHKSVPIKNENDLLVAGTEIWNLCGALKFSSLEAMQVRTVVSELGRNILRFAGEGEILIRLIDGPGLRLVFSDNGPGIADIEQAMSYGFSTGGSLGLGLPGSKKLADHFEIYSEVGKGTQVTFVKYARSALRPGSAAAREVARNADLPGTRRLAAPPSSFGRAAGSAGASPLLRPGGPVRILRPPPKPDPPRPGRPGPEAGK